MFLDDFLVTFPKCYDTQVGDIGPVDLLFVFDLGFYSPVHTVKVMLIRQVS